MLAKDLKALGVYVRTVADLLALRDWTFEIDKDPCDDDATATCRPCEGRKVAVISFSADFRNRPADEQRQTVVHELVHCHHASASDIVRLDVVKHLAQSTYDMLWGAFSRQMEYMVDGLADAIAPLMPHVDWPQGGK